ncbi:hypothetical protein HJ590_14040 [Naumannella sp. ID2617S]|nr:hypothetical protein [Naumannella sp. ID2617S]
MSTPAETTRTTAADLTTLVSAIPGVRGIEPGITSTLRALDARIRRSQTTNARYGLLVEPDSGTITVEIGVDASRPVRQIVEDTQRAVQKALAGSESAELTVLVRVQSVAHTESVASKESAAESVSP